MRNKWYISIIIILLIALGVNLDCATVPNQEIVLQFTDTHHSSKQIQQAVTRIKTQLEALGAATLKIQDLGNGALKITYYSDLEVSEIKEVFRAYENTTIDYTYYYSHTRDNTPFPADNEEIKGYQINIHEIGGAQDVTSTSGFVLESKSEIIRFFTPDKPALRSRPPEVAANTTQKLAYIVYYAVSIRIQQAPYTIPEVRAGPWV